MNALRHDISARSQLFEHYSQVRQATLHRASRLSLEDQALQSMPDASPTKWHLGHTTWFVEKFVLEPFAQPDYRSERLHDTIFNSYYDAVGGRTPRHERGLLSRPSLVDVLSYRRKVDDAAFALFDAATEGDLVAIRRAVLLALNHEEQHQELMLTDILHAFSRNPEFPAYGSFADPYVAAVSDSTRWVEHGGGLATMGRRAASNGFAFDNEAHPHKVYLQPFSIASRLVTQGEFAEFVADGGYEDPRLWLSEGWHVAQSEGWKHPIYWVPAGDARFDQEPAHRWRTFGLAGLEAMNPSAPVTNISFFEADAFARWDGARLPTEFEWEAAASLPDMEQLIGYAWQWTRSSYEPYPGFKPWDGMAAEYNGKFMSGQMVLRGSSFATPLGHARPTYRNYFPPSARWQFAGIRLARVG